MRVKKVTVLDQKLRASSIPVQNEPISITQSCESSAVCRFLFCVFFSLFMSLFFFLFLSSQFSTKYYNQLQSIIVISLSIKNGSQPGLSTFEKCFAWEIKSYHLEPTTVCVLTCEKNKTSKTTKLKQTNKQTPQQSNKQKQTPLGAFSASLYFIHVYFVMQEILYARRERGRKR